MYEDTEIDLRTALNASDNLTDYLNPVNADAPNIRVGIVPVADDRVNPLGTKGLGEIAIVGMNAAGANRVFHAAGKRIRDLSVRIEPLLLKSGRSAEPRPQPSGLAPDQA